MDAQAEFDKLSRDEMQEMILALYYENRNLKKEIVDKELTILICNQRLHGMRKARSNVSKGLKYWKARAEELKQKPTEFKKDVATIYIGC